MKEEEENMRRSGIWMGEWSEKWEPENQEQVKFTIKMLQLQRVSTLFALIISTKHTFL